MILFVGNTPSLAMVGLLSILLSGGFLFYEIFDKEFFEAGYSTGVSPMVCRIFLQSLEYPEETGRPTQAVTGGGRSSVENLDSKIIMT